MFDNETSIQSDSEKFFSFFSWTHTKESCAFFPRRPCIPWWRAAAKIPAFTYKGIILHTLPDWVTAVLLAVHLCESVLLCKLLLKSSSLPSDLLLRHRKGDSEETTEASSRAETDKNRGEEACWWDFCWFQDKWTLKTLVMCGDKLTSWVLGKILEEEICV